MSTRIYKSRYYRAELFKGCKKAQTMASYDWMNSHRPPINVCTPLLPPVAILNYRYYAKQALFNGIHLKSAATVAGSEQFYSRLSKDRPQSRPVINAANYRFLPARVATCQIEPNQYLTILIYNSSFLSLPKTRPGSTLLRRVRPNLRIMAMR